MRASTRIRNLLNDYVNGLTIVEICDKLDMINENVRTALQGMPDVYIERWEKRAKVGPPSAIWCAVYVPPNAPRPVAETNEQRSRKQREYTNDWRRRKRDADRKGVPTPLKVRKKIEPEQTPEKFPSQGLTQIRGPWPTHH